MMSSVLKWSSMAFVGLVAGLYTAFVAQCFWNWFAVPALHLSSLSFLQMLGLLWLIQLLTARSPAADDKRWTLLASMIELCVPEEKQEEVADLKEVDPLENILAVFSTIFGQVVGNTLTLVLGFTLHAVIV
jgi:hypothetical protein